MSKHYVRRVSSAFTMYLEQQGTAYERTSGRGKARSLRFTIQLPSAGARHCRLVQVHGDLYFIVQVGRFKPIRLRGLGEFLEDLTLSRIEVVNGRIKWALPLDEETFPGMDVVGLFKTVDEDISATLATLRRIAPHPYAAPPFWIPAPRHGGEHYPQ